MILCAQWISLQGACPFTAADEPRQGWTIVEGLGAELKEVEAHQVFRGSVPCLGGFSATLAWGSSCLWFCSSLSWGARSLCQLPPLQTEIGHR